MQCLDPVAPPSAEEIEGIPVWIHPVVIPDDHHQAINTLTHVGVPGHQEDLGYTGKIA